MSLLSLLEQDLVWIDGRQNVVPLKEMTASHRRNLIAFLERKADRIKNAYEWSLLAIPGPSGEMAQQCYEDALADLWDQDALEWLNERPLMVELRRREAKYNSPRALKKRQRQRDREHADAIARKEREQMGIPW